MYLVLGTYDHLCVRCLSNQSNQQGNHHEWSSRHSAYATVAATSLVSLYLVSHNFCFIQYITVKHNFIIFVWNLKVSNENWWYSRLTPLSKMFWLCSLPNEQVYKLSWVSMNISDSQSNNLLKPKNFVWNRKILWF